MPDLFWPAYVRISDARLVGWECELYFRELKLDVRNAPDTIGGGAQP
jgi:hypothetical protein